MSERSEELSANLMSVQHRIAVAARAAGRSPEEITLVVVTKTFPVEDIHLLYELGVRNFGENRDQEGSVKAPELPTDSIWHFQGQIQSNKLKSICAWADVIHSLDDLKHAQKISELGTNARILIQVALEAKFREGRGGVDPELLPDFLMDAITRKRLNVTGLMAVAPLDEAAPPAFARLHEIFTYSRSNWPQLSTISAGMSGDFEAAISQGATLVRVGSSILGHRAPLL
jgi:pyridoxal phosphate enzyme (YggS family)